MTRREFLSGGLCAGALTWAAVSALSALVTGCGRRRSQFRGELGL